MSTRSSGPSYDMQMMISKVKYNFACTFIAIFLTAGSIVRAQEKALRPLTPDDLFKLEDIGQVVPSPDGRWLAYVIKRSRSTALIHTRPFLEGNDRGDVWLVSMSGGKPQNLTNGLVDGSGWWAPTWSPDSQRLAMLSTRGENVRLWTWEKSTRRLKRLTERAVDIAATQQAPFAWLNNQQIVSAVLHQGHKPNAMTVEMRAAEIAMREWPKAWRGQVATASAFESGVPVRLGQRPQGELLLIDVTKGNRQLSTAVNFRELRINPDQQHIAILKATDVKRPESDKPLTTGRPQFVYHAAVFTRDGKQVLLDTTKVKDVQPGSLRWSPEGKSLALIGRISSAGAQAVICVLATNVCQAVSASDEAASLMWGAEHSLLMLSKPEGNRQDWWVLNVSKQKRNLTASMKTVPRELIRVAGGEAVVGLADGELWRIRLEGVGPENLTSDFEPRITSIVWPTAANENSASKVIAGVRSGPTTDWYRIDLSSRQTTSISKPKPEVTIAGVHPESDTTIMTARDRAGTYLWLTRTESTAIVETNMHLREIAQTEFKKIEYRSTDGQQLKGWVLLPVGYRSGQRYPLITVVYGGQIFGDNPPGGHNRSINNSSSLNYHLLAAHGYAVLFPSIPLKPEGQASDPYVDFPKSVIPAVDKVIEEGIADPKRLGVMGQSYGGYTTYSLIAQTNRFQAAVSLAGLSELSSLYGIFDARFRYDQFPDGRMFMMSLAEGGQLRMGNPPWKDSERYLRNSPLFYADRIETPLLIMQGDMDYVAMQQGEQMYTALYRQNKRSSFVRYWGEGHVLEGPANIRDMWQRIYKWFDHYLRAEVTK